MAKQDSITRKKPKKKESLKDLEWAKRMSMYNSFCKQLHEGDILYNIDITNMWGEYLLVAAKSVFNVEGLKVYFVLLFGLDKNEGTFKSNNIRISLSPEKLENLTYLKLVGKCKFNTVAHVYNEDINEELEAKYKKIDPWKYNKKLDTRKPVRRKYDSTGELVIKSMD